MESAAPGAPPAPPRGTCPGMCPAEEFARRRRQGRLHGLELGPPPERRPSPSRAVKEYSRPAAGKPPPRPEQLRPPPVLLATVRHLLATGGEEGEGRAAAAAAAERCAFVADRLRAVRLDLTLQRVSGRPGAALLERALVYLLHAGARLAARGDAHLHRAQVQETFAALRRAYRPQQPPQPQQPRPDDDDDEAPAAQPRFQALFLLYNLGSPEALWQILQLPDDIRGSPELCTALAVNWAFLERNFARFFRLARALPYLQSCALHQHLGRARRLALLTFSHGFSARNCRYPLAQLAQLLATDTLEEAADLCRAHGLAMGDGDVVVFQKGSFRDAGTLDHKPSRLLVDGKWGKTTLLELSEDVCSSWGHV
ncbi:SAC3 domain-containing protein 1 [Elgaria multicarinata webbii]|uniref:SAC3 domain-containing protein 1 n=1 Tax=Elgaria multicarinata webbii TaxID=159646 RepID=UPI002FCCFADD